jgi:hypothetical protein
MGMSCHNLFIEKRSTSIGDVNTYLLHLQVSDKGSEKQLWPVVMCCDVKFSLEMLQKAL